MAHTPPPRRTKLEPTPREEEEGSPYTHEPQPDPDEDDYDTDEDDYDTADEDDDEDDEDDDGADVQQALREEYQSAADYIDQDVAPLRIKATQYYNGEPFGDEEKGRSAVVITELRDKVMAMLPGILRVFTSGEKTVELQPNGPEDVDMAAQATAAINYLIDADGNSSFRTYYNGFKDALTEKVGVLKWWWDKSTQTEGVSWTGITQDQVELLKLDPELEITSTAKHLYMDPELQQALDAATQQGNASAIAEIQALLEPTFDVKAKRTRKRGNIRHASVPPEQFIISRDATCEDDATLIGERRLATVSELIAMGFDAEEVRDRAGQTGANVNNETIVRNPSSDPARTSSSGDESMQRVLFVDCLLRVDQDGDGIAELRHIQAIGDDLLIVYNEPEADVGYALLCPNPTPHMVFGLSVADDTMDIQSIKSHVMRSTLDSLANNIFPTTVILDGAVEVEDVLNTEVGRVIREKAPNAVRTLVEPFIGQQALQVMEYLDGMSAARTGVTPASQGLDPDVMQSTTKAAVNATVNAAQDRIEMVVRVFAETGVSRFFRGIYRTLIRHQDKPRMIRLQGQWTEVDPRYWNSDMDTVVAVGLGRGDEEQKVMALTQIAGKQEQILTTYGPKNPMVDIGQLRNTYSEIVRLAGFKDTARFFKEVSPAVVQASQQAAGDQKPPDPAMILAQVEREKTQADIAMAQQKSQLDLVKAAAEDDRERDKMWIDAFLRAAEMQAKYGAQLDIASLRAETEKERNFMASMDGAQAAAQATAQRAQAAQQAQQVAMQRDQMGAGNALVKNQMGAANDAERNRMQAQISQAKAQAMAQRQTNGPPGATNPNGGVQ